MPEASFICAPHEGAVALLRGKKPVASKVFYKLLPELRARAFTVSGLAGATVLQRVRDAVAAVPQEPDGMTWDQAKREIADELEKAHFGEEAAEARANLILRVNTFYFPGLLGQHLPCRNGGRRHDAPPISPRGPGQGADAIAPGAGRHRAAQGRPILEHAHRAVGTHWLRLLCAAGEPGSGGGTHCGSEIGSD